MIKKLFTFTIFIFIFFPNLVSSKSTYFNEGKILFENKKYKEAQFKFEQEIVYNPKSEKSYFYLSKIFKINENIVLEESNLQTVILLNPNNEEAIFELASLHIKKSNFSEAENLIKKFKTICKKLCLNTKLLNKKLSDSLKK